jgi:tetratricopeptide (TPR) repeat protein
MTAFFVSFILYLVTLFPSAAPYRDTGEMVSVAKTLGIAHPPGYPFYTLLSKIFLFILPWGNAGYKMNVLSALAGAVSVYLMYKILNIFSFKKRYSFALSLLFATSYLQWYLSLVSEMYTLNTLFAAAVLLIVFKGSLKREKYTNYTYLFFFVAALGMGNRMDILLMSAGIFLLVFLNEKPLKFSRILISFLIFIIGFSIYIYLPLRSGNGALLNWNNPSDLARFWGSLTRKTHGSTLDLLSESYMKGENFPATLKFYFNHVISGYAFFGLALGILGFYHIYVKRKDMALATLAAWVFSGPLFIYLANMPPNPHALAILEAHFLLPNMIFFIWITFGVKYLLDKVQDNFSRGIIYTFSASLVFINCFGNLPGINKRNNFVAYDYSKNVLRSLPPKSIIVLKEDVQLFSLWNRQIVEKQRPDAAVISQGLSGTEWYQQSLRKMHNELALSQLKTPQGWKALAENNARKVFFSGDVDFLKVEGFTQTPTGLITELSKTKNAEERDFLLRYIYPYRGSYSYDAYREFFTPDLIEEYAKAYLRAGQSYMEKKEYEKARIYLRMSLNSKVLLPVAANFLSFTYYEQGRYEEAVAEYRSAVNLYHKILEKTVEYNSLPDIKEGLKSELSNVYISLGVCLEKTGREEESLKCYQNAVETWPYNERAHFNKSVIYWKRGMWKNVISELEKALKINPSYREAAYYLHLARQKYNESADK